jgi:hypothetical protein
MTVSIGKMKCRAFFLVLLNAFIKAIIPLRAIKIPSTIRTMSLRVLPKMMIAIPMIRLTAPPAPVI